MTGTTPLTVEVAPLAKDPMVAAFQKLLTPSDQTLRLRGARGISTYDEIRRDPHAFALLQKRVLEVCSRAWRVDPASDARKDRKAADLVESQLKGINFDRLTRGLLGAVLKGFSVAEVIWENRGGIWTVARAPVRKQRRFAFTVDGELRHLARTAGFEGEPVPDRKFIIHRHSIEDDDDDPYGTGLGSVLYWPAWFKRQVLGNWLRGSERFASPTAHGTYSGAFDQDKQRELMDALRSLANDTAIVTPDGVAINLLEAKNSGGGDVLEALSRYLDEVMSEAVLGETLSTNSGQRGARSLGEVHNEVRQAIAKADSDLISETLNHSLVQWIIDINMPGAGYPTVWRDFSAEEDLDKKASRDKTIHDMGYRPKTADYINETYGGDWVETSQKQADNPSSGIPLPDKTGGQTAAALFADAPDYTDEALAAMLEAAAAPLTDAMLSVIGREVEAAADFSDLTDRLARLGSELGIDDLGALMEAAMTAGLLSGRASALQG